MLQSGRKVATVTLVAAVVVVSVLAVGVRAQTEILIPVEDCIRVNPDPTFLSCSQYSETYEDLYAGLPYDDVPDYTQCVRNRCVCTTEKDSVDGAWTTSGMYCSAFGWNETGLLTCNHMVECFRIYWKCLGDAVMNRHSDPAITLTAAEQAAVDAIVAHGHTPGQSYEVTDLYKSCRMHMCEAAASRRNCGLITCVPNNTQCYEYIRPPPLPDVHQLCTQGCRAVLIMMAVTITTFTSAVMCCACCPAVVKENEPLITGEDEGNSKKKKKNKRRRDSDTPDSNFGVDSSPEGSQQGTPKAEGEEKPE